jgi:hypothetical protein
LPLLPSVGTRVLSSTAVSLFRRTAMLGAMSLRTVARPAGAALGVVVLALGVSACGGTGTSSPTASSTTAGTTTGTGTVTAGTAIAAIDAANASVPLRSAAAAAYAVGLTGCAMRAASEPAGAVEWDAWSPVSRLPGMSRTFTVTNGTASAAITRTPRSASWRPPGGPNCTIGPGGVITPM